jgi:hypothetical protein
MRILRYFVLCSALAWNCAVSAAEGAVRILSPTDGAKLDAMALHKITYEVDPGPRGDHIHIYVDGGEAGILRQLKGSFTLPEPLKPGKHDICIKVVNKNHTPIGVERCITVAAE